MKTFIIAFIIITLNTATIAQTSAAPAPSNPDQSFVLDTPPKVIDIPKELAGQSSPVSGQAPDTISPIGLSEPEIKNLIEAALHVQHAEPIKTDTYYILHLVQHRDGTAGSVSDAWYIYFCGWQNISNKTSCMHSLNWRLKLNDPDWKNHYKEARIFGARKLSLLYIHYNVPTGHLQEGNSQAELLVNTRGPNGEKIAAIPKVFSTDKQQFTEETFLPITYTIFISKKTPAIIDNLKAVIQQFFPQAAANQLSLVDLKYQALTSAKLDMVIDYPTSDIAVSAQRGQGRTNIGSKKFDNERKYFLDFGFAIPLSKIKELQLNGPTLIPQPVDKSRIYGMVSLFPLGPVDTKASAVWFRAPQLLYGMAINSKPWDNHLFAVGFLNKYIQPFVGVTLTNKQVRTPTDNDPGLKWSSRIAYGIQISAGSISGLIKKASK